MNRVLRLLPFVILYASLACVSLTAAAGQQALIADNWTAPSSRQAKTPFAPKPFGDDNIFKGESEEWLADAIIKLEVGSFRPIEDKAVLDYISQVGNNLVKYSAAPTRQYQFIPTSSLELDAMTVGGGRIYITRGMLELLESEDELAAVLAHEIGHDAFGHIPKTVTRQMFWMTGTRKVRSASEAEAELRKLLAAYDKSYLASLGENLLGFSRANELEADRAAFYNLYKAGYNPRALGTALQRMERKLDEEEGEPDSARKFILLLLGAHPPTDQRSMAIAWESNFVKMPLKNARYQSAAFECMKARITSLPK